LWRPTSWLTRNGDDITNQLKPLIGGSGFTGNAPGGTSRWSGRERKPVQLEPKLVAEVSADHIENGRFRHGSRPIRWRDDKEPNACTMDQIGGRQIAKGTAVSAGNMYLLTFRKRLDGNLMRQTDLFGKSIERNGCHVETLERLAQGNRSPLFSISYEGWLSLLSA
jgi:hypothetical protein